MYNRYMSGGQFVPLEADPPPSGAGTPRQARPGSERAGATMGKADLLDDVTGKISRLIGGIFPRTGAEDLDAGDILLLLIILFLLLEGDNLEIVITLGLMLLLGLSDRKDDHS